ncbi:hypothetical protein WA026_010279 [Henosepilachna vigintioctopunctata]|uniref:Uncharacterized protein n=1 Tax=Henosepilachna vigintioctopunctata TaxID=420089 RepID=A0AAW1UK10_9CUCU
MSSSSEDSERDEIIQYEESDNASDFEDQIVNKDKSDSMELQGLGKGVLVKYSTKKSVEHFIGQIIDLNINDYFVKFTKFLNGKFFWPEKEDSDIER